MPGNNKSYSVIAGHYDRMMNHVDYKMWANYLRSIFKHWHIAPRNIVDLSCGTGSLLYNLKNHKWKLYGSDLSENMLLAAQKKVSVPLVCSNLTGLPYKKAAFDVALVMYDTMNYIIDNIDIQRIFNELYLIIRPGGWLIFDIVTPFICEQDFRDYYESDFENGSGYERRSWFISESNRQFNEFTVWSGTEKQTELHEQKIRPLDEWIDLVQESQFLLDHYVEDFTFHKGHNQSDRIHFICKR